MAVVFFRLSSAKKSPPLSLTAENFRACAGVPTGACGVMIGIAPPFAPPSIARKSRANGAWVYRFSSSGERYKVIKGRVLTAKRN